MDDIITKFGVELEICVRVGPECIKYEGAETLSNIDHHKRFDMYFKHVLVPNARANPELIRQFPLICYNYPGKTFIYDLNKPFSFFGKINSRAPTANENTLIEQYKLPIFTEDPTVLCGDATSWDAPFMRDIYNNNLKRHIELGDSIGFEMISPVLQISGEATPEKIAEGLRPILLLFGLNRSNCFMSNYTSGFHVNISVERNGRILSITKTPLIHHIMKEYIDYESEHYGVVRSRRPLENPKYTSHWAKPMQKRIRPEHNSLVNLFASNFLKAKEGGLKIKDGEILEFRLFQSESDIKLLEKYSGDAIQIVHKGIASNNSGVMIDPDEYNETVRGLLNREELRMHGPDRAGVKRRGGRRCWMQRHKTEHERRSKKLGKTRNGSRTIRIRNATRRRVK